MIFSAIVCFLTLREAMSNKKNGNDDKVSSSRRARGVTASQAGSANSDSLIGNLVPRPAASLQMDEKLFLHKEEADRLRRRRDHTSTSSDERHEMIDACRQRNSAKRRRVPKVVKPPPMNLKPPPSGGLPSEESQDSKPAARLTTTGESSGSSEESDDPSHEEDSPPEGGSTPTPLRPDSDAPLIRAEGQLARHPEMTDAEAVLAAKREYNRRNAARARKRNRTLVTDLQQNVYKLAADIANLKADNSKLRAKLHTLTEDNAALVQAQQTIATGHRASAAAPVASTSTLPAQDLLQLVKSGAIQNEQLNQQAETPLDSMSQRSAAASAAQMGASPNSSFTSSPPFNPVGTPLPPTNSQVEGMHQVLQMINARSLQREQLVQDLELRQQQQQQQRQSDEARHQMMQLVDQIQLQQQQQQHYQNQVLQMLQQRQEQQSANNLASPRGQNLIHLVSQASASALQSQWPAFSPSQPAPTSTQATSTSESPNTPSPPARK